MYLQVTSLLEKSSNHTLTYVASTQISYLTFAHVVCRSSSHAQNSCIHLEFTHNQWGEQILIHTSVWNRYSFTLVCETDICSASECEQIFIHASRCEQIFIHTSECEQIFICTSRCEQIFIHASAANRYSFTLAVHTLEISLLLDFCPTAPTLFDSHKSLDKVYSSYTVHYK